MKETDYSVPDSISRSPPHLPHPGTVRYRVQSLENLVTVGDSCGKRSLTGWGSLGLHGTCGDAGRE